MDPDDGTFDPIQVGSQPWYAWLGDHQGFIYEGVAGHFTARRELRRGIGYWYGYRRHEGKLNKVYLGKSEELKQENLEQASSLLAGQIPFGQISGNGISEDLITSSRQQEVTIIPTAGEWARGIPLASDQIQTTCFTTKDYRTTPPDPKNQRPSDTALRAEWIRKDHSAE